MAIHESFLRKILDRGILWHGKSKQSAQVFSAKIECFWTCFFNELGLALSLIVFVNIYTGCYYSLVCWPLLSFLLFALGTQAYAGLFPVTNDGDPSCFDAFWLTDVTDFLSTHSVKLAFFNPDSHSSHCDVRPLTY